jgi:hypothetical protein
MHISDSNLNVFICGNRDYIQGTQIVARSIDKLKLASSLLLQCQFKEILRNLVRLSVSDSDRTSSIGEAIFQDNQGVRRTVYFMKSEVKAACLDEEMKIDWLVRKGDKPLFGIINFKDVKNIEDALNVMVQGVKYLHSELNNSVYDIWWTGLRGATMSTDWPKSRSSGTIEVTPQRVLRDNKVYQTLLRLKWTFDSDEPDQSATISFVVKSEVDIHVD